jgi:hypothetical protein
MNSPQLSSSATTGLHQVQGQAAGGGVDDSHSHSHSPSSKDVNYVTSVQQHEGALSKGALKTRRWRDRKKQADDQVKEELQKTKELCKKLMTHNQELRERLRFLGAPDPAVALDVNESIKMDMDMDITGATGKTAVKSASAVDMVCPNTNNRASTSNIKTSKKKPSQAQANKRPSTGNIGLGLGLGEHVDVDVNIHMDIGKTCTVVVPISNTISSTREAACASMCEETLIVLPVVADHRSSSSPMNDSRIRHRINDSKTSSTNTSKKAKRFEQEEINKAIAFVSMASGKPHEYHDDCLKFIVNHNEEATVPATVTSTDAAVIDVPAVASPQAHYQDHQDLLSSSLLQELLLLAL